MKDGGNWYAYCGNDPVNFVDPSGYRQDQYGRAYVSGIDKPKPVLKPVLKPTIVPRPTLSPGMASRTGLSYLPKYTKKDQMEAGSMWLGVVPGVSTGKDVIELKTGKDIVTKRKLTKTDRVLAAVGVITPFSSSELKAVKILGKEVTKGAGEAKNIVGTTYNDIKPTQEFVNKAKVDEYAQKLINGERIDPIDVTDVPGKGKYITEGHHRYVASQQTGIPVDMNVTQGQGAVGMKDWLEVQWKEFINESQFWGD